MARQRWNVWVCHRRMGKTTLALYCLLEGALTCPKPHARFAYVAPLRNQAKLIVWDILKRLTAPLRDIKANEAELRVDVPNGHRIQLFGADNPDSLRGPYWDGVVWDEYAQMRPRVWSEVVRPALADREGWATFIGTPLGKNHFYDLYHQAQSDPAWHTAIYRASETGVLDDAELASARATMSPEQYAQEFECSWESALIGSYYGSYLETAQAEDRVTRVPWEPNTPVHTAWDLGISDATAIWFLQPVGRMLHVIDYLEASDHGLEWYAKVLKDKPYTYGRHFFPHDIEARDFSSDGRTRLAMAEQLGLRPAVVVPRGDVADGIQAVRSLFPRFVFDTEKCHDGIEALKAYRREWSETRKTWGEHPLHDWCLMGDTAILTRNGKYRIMDLSLTGEVLTSCGWKAYHSPRITRRNAPLVEVVFNDGFTVKCTAEHLFKTVSGWISAQHLQTGSVIQSCSIPSSSITTGFSTVSGRATAIFRAGMAICTFTSGKLSLASDRLASIFTTAMGMPAIMRLATWNASPNTSISVFPGSSGPRSRPGSGLRRWPALGLRSGMPQRKGGSGIADMPSAVNLGRNGHARTSRVSIVGRALRHWCAGKGIRSTVAMRVNTRPILLASKPVTPVSMLRGLVSSVGRPLLRLRHAACIVKSTVAKRVVIGKWCGEQVSKRKPTVLRVVQVRHLDERADVWCLTVPGLEEFALANGALVHNSSHAADSLRTFAVGYQDETPAVHIPSSFYHPGRNLWGRR